MQPFITTEERIRFIRSDAVTQISLRSERRNAPFDIASSAQRSLWRHSHAPLPAEADAKRTDPLSATKRSKEPSSLRRRQPTHVRAGRCCETVTTRRPQFQLVQQLRFRLQQLHFRLQQLGLFRRQPTLFRSSLNRQLHAIPFRQWRR